MDRRKDIAREISRIYCPLTPLGVDMLASILVPMKFQKGDTILKEGSVCNALYFVDKGMVRQYYYKNKKDVTEHFSFEGRIVFCIESLLKQEPSRLIVEALENTTLYAIPYETLLGLMVRNQEMEMLYRKILEHVAISSQEHADSQRFENAAERYERLLREKPEIVLRAPMVHIASFLQMTPETLSRVRGASAGAAKTNPPRELTDPWWTRTNTK
ncbi:MAG: Crp/Fnr family transcriptional regulator [Bacteroidaceae bacterium]|nr:Crp/Fnr family transcriptional regulator [Bacteroidaceae bacterium]MBQ9171370.1 Crp/Fnr family transcriptional regulator [Bacteroidaceae bacterium]MBQ9293402.1 Crp/Fnr family transcriptional regulator [Bacteroidaceae bacterium]